MSRLLTRAVSRFVCILTLAMALAPALAAQDPIPLRVGEAVSGSLVSGDTIRYTLDTRPEHLVRGVVEQVSVNVAVRIVRPDGSQVRSVDVRVRGEEPFQFETEQEGAYGLQVIPVDEEEGDFRIRLDRLEPVATDPEALADQLLSAYDGPDSPGAAVRVWRNGETLFSRTYGMANLAYGIPFEADSPTNIGSTSKQFTGFAIMLLVERGQLSLDDDVRDHVPELPDFGETVQVRHLLSHASGYREIYNLLIMAGRRFDQGDYISRDEIIRVVQNQPSLQNSPGAEWNYNNTAYGLAALIVERVSGQSFTRFMEENVFGPLGMNRSMARPHAQAIVEGRTMGYAPDEQGGYREIRDLGGAIGAGAVYASIEDLQTWVENYMEPRVGTRATVEEMMTPFVTTAGDTTSYGLGLMIDEHRGLKRVHHGGADIAHRSMLVYYPEIGAGITTQSNHASFNSGVAFRLAEAFFAEHMEPEEEAVAEEEDEGESSSDEEPEEDEWTPTEAELRAFTGRYLSEEVETFYTVALEGDSLVLQHRRRDDATMTPGEEDHFTAGTLRITFERDRSGRVIAFYLDNARTRDVRFQRLR
jgi:CubicO group peptidase (beta-lactamase class C family)